MKTVKHEDLKSTYKTIRPEDSISAELYIDLFEKYHELRAVVKDHCAIQIELTGGVHTRFRELLIEFIRDAK